MKYKDFKTMSESEMKSVKGGSIRMEGCVMSCCFLWDPLNGRCGIPVTVSVGSCNPNSWDFYGCDTVNGPEPTCSCYGNGGGGWV